MHHKNHNSLKLDLFPSVLCWMRSWLYVTMNFIKCQLLSKVNWTGFNIDTSRLYRLISSKNSSFSELMDKPSLQMYERIEKSLESLYWLSLLPRSHCYHGIFFICIFNNFYTPFIYFWNNISLYTSCHCYHRTHETHRTLTHSHDKTRLHSLRCHVARGTVVLEFRNSEPFLSFLPFFVYFNIFSLYITVYFGFIFHSIWWVN